MPRAGAKKPRETGASLADAAVGLAREGWAVFPCGADKAPLVKDGFHAASAEPDEVAAMPWDRAALIGAAIPEGQVVLDVDPRNAGDETMQALKNAGQKLPRTRVVKTGGAGTHYYFRVPDSVELRGRLGPGVDIKRAGRGYVIVPPSPGYEVLKHDPPGALPAWLLDALSTPEREATAGEAASEPRYFKWEQGTAYGLAALERSVGRLASARPGERNEELNKAAFAVAQLVAGGELEDKHAREVIETAAARLFDDPRHDQATIASGWEAGLTEPRSAPPRETPNKGVKSQTLETSHDEEHFWINWLVDEPPPPYLLDPILPENAYVLVYGPAEAAKSMVWAAIGAQASQRGIRTTLYSLENPAVTDRDRLRRITPGPDPANFRATNEPLDMNDPVQFDALVERERNYGTRLLIVDTYSHAFESRTEDGNARAIAFARRVRYLMHEVGCSVVVIDHTGYVHDEPRDASAKRQQVDVCILMQPVGTWEKGKTFSEFRMENRKAARFGNPFDYSGKLRGKLGDPIVLEWQGGEPTWRV